MIGLKTCSDNLRYVQLSTKAHAVHNLAASDWNTLRHDRQQVFSSLTYFSFSFSRPGLQTLEIIKAWPFVVIKHGVLYGVSDEDRRPCIHNSRLEKQPCRILII